MERPENDLTRMVADEFLKELVPSHPDNKQHWYLNRQMPKDDVSKYKPKIESYKNNLGTELTDDFLRNLGQTEEIRYVNKKENEF